MHLEKERKPVWRQAFASLTKDAHLVAGVTSVYPLVVLSLVYLVWAVAGIQLGHTPAANHYWDDPDSIGILVTLLRYPTVLLLFAWIAVLPFNIFFTLMSLAPPLRQPWKSRLWLLLLPALAWTLFFVVLRRDPYQIIGWFVD